MTTKAMIVDFPDDKKELLKRTFCKGLSDDEMALYMAICKRTGLDPTAKHIFPVPRYDSKEKCMVTTFQISIDGFRAIAERTGRYAPGRESTFVYDDKKQLISATAYIKKLTADGTWHEVSSTAFFDEYAQTNKEGKLTNFWAAMPHVMLSKCAESNALRRAFPLEMSGLYTEDEMRNPVNQPSVELSEIMEILGNYTELELPILEWAGIDHISKLPEGKHKSVLTQLKKQIDNLRKGDISL